MFTAKQPSLIETKKSSASPKVASTMTVSTNPFVRHGVKKTVSVPSGNGSLKYSTTGSDFVDQFATVSTYRTPRTYQQVSADMEKLWKQNKLLALTFVFYLRTITRVVNLFKGGRTKSPQRGQGMKHEGIFRMIWIAVNAPDTFWKNITLFISIGSWKDIITMLSYDLQWNGWKGRVLDWNKFGQLILAGLENPNNSELVKKYLPQIKANSQCKTLPSQADTIIGKWICSLLFGGKPEGSDSGATYKKYRKLKSSGTAHEWQQLISQGKFLEINFDSIHGRALAQLVSSKFLSNNNLTDKYTKWIENKPVAKFVGYPHELIMGKILNKLASYQIKTIDAQFNNLVEVAKKGLSTQGLRPISVLDCSGSMDSPMYLGGGVVGKLKSIEVAVSSALFFDEMINNGSPFKNHYLSFSNGCNMHSFSGKGFTQRFFTSPRSGYGGTNFQSVFDFFANYKRTHPTLSEEFVPNFIVCFSDGEFNDVTSKIETNVSAGRKILQDAGFSKEYCENFGICFVDLPNTFYGYRGTPKFETFGDEKNTFYFSGYDLSPLAFLFGVEGKNGEVASIPKTAEELFLAAMDQEVFNMLEL